MKTTDFTIGQQLLYVPNQQCVGSKELCFHVVKSIGRKWINAGLPGSTRADERFLPETMIADGGDYVSPGAYYLSEAEYRDACDANAAWGELNEWLRCQRRPAGLKASAIRAALKALQEHNAIELTGRWSEAPEGPR